MVPLDGSPHSLKALQVSLQIAKKFNGKITLIHVYSVNAGYMSSAEPTSLIPPNMSLIPATAYSRVVESTRKRGTKILEEGEPQVEAEGIEVELMLREGHHIVQEILNVLDDRGFDLVVMGARGLSKIKKILLGSVTDGVIRNTPCSVLITK